MKVSKESAARHRDSLLQTAAAQIRKTGFDALNVTELAQSAGLTHGALYSHFGSKQGLLPAAFARAVSDSQMPMSRATLEEFLTRYLSPGHREHPERGCAVAALVSEINRQPPEVQKEFSAGVTNLVRILKDKIDTEYGAERSSEKAIVAVASMVGAIALSRSISETDKPLANAFLAVTKEKILNDVK